MEIYGAGGAQGENGLDELPKRRRGPVVVHEPVVDLVSEVNVDEIPNFVALNVPEDRNCIVEGEEGRVALGHEILHENEPLARANDGEG